MIDLSICIVNWNTGDLLAACVDSVLRTTHSSRFEVIVVDNASHDDSLDRLTSLVNGNPHIRVLRSQRNLGFAAGNNVALTASSGRYVVLLNPDTIVHDGAFDTAVAFLDAHPGCGAMGPRLLNADGTLQPSIGHFPTLAGMFWETTRLNRVFPRVKLFSSFKRFDMDYDHQQAVDQPSGACLFVRRSAIDGADGDLKAVGLLDERYFMYYEEVDWCYRIKRAGWQILYTPTIVVTHIGGQSSNQNLTVRIVENAASRLRYFQKHYAQRTFTQFALRAMMLVELLVRTLVLVTKTMLLRQRWEQARQILQRYAQVARLVLGLQKTKTTL